MFHKSKKKELKCVFFPIDEFIHLKKFRQGRTNFNFFLTDLAAERRWKGGRDIKVLGITESMDERTLAPSWIFFSFSFLKKIQFIQKGDAALVNGFTQN